LTIANHDRGEKIACPHCGSDNVEQRWADFYAITSKKSAAWQLSRPAWPACICTMLRHWPRTGCRT